MSIKNSTVQSVKKPGDNHRVKKTDANHTVAVASNGAVIADHLNPLDPRHKHPNKERSHETGDKVEHDASAHNGDAVTSHDTNGGAVQAADTSTAPTDASTGVMSDASSPAGDASGSADVGGTTDGSSEAGAGAAPAASSGVPTSVWLSLLGAAVVGGVAAAVASGGGGSSGGSSSSSSTTAASGTTISGEVADGLIKGAHIYIDVNGDGIPVAAGDTGVVTDANGNFSLTTTLKGSIIAVGGVNIDTGLPNTVTLMAPQGSTVVNPLTTLVEAYAAQHGVSVATADAVIAQGLGIPAGVSLTTYDPLAAAANDPTALAVQKIAAQIATILTVTANSEAGSVSSTAQASMLSALTNAVANAGQTPINLASSSVLSSINSDAGNLLNTGELNSATTSNVAIGQATTLNSGSADSVAAAQSATLTTLTETVAGAQALVASGSSTTYDLSDSAANLAAAPASLAANVVNVVATTAATVAQATAIHAFANSGTQTYTISDTAAHILAGGAAVTAAGSVVTTDAFVSAGDATALYALNAHTTITAIHDTAANLLLSANHSAVASASAVTVTDSFVSVANADALHALNSATVIGAVDDTAAALLAAIGHGDVGLTGVTSLVTTDATAVTLSVADAATLLNAHVTITNGYNLVDSEASLLAAIQNNAIAFTSIGAGTISTNDATAVSLDLSDADTLLNAHVVITNGYNLVDSEASLLAAIQNNAIAFTSIGAGTISTNDATAVSLDLSDADTLLNTHVVITNGYNLVDSEASLLAAIQNNAIAFTSIGAGTISTNDATAVSLDLSDADTLLNAHVVITNGYNLSDSEASLLAAIQNHDIAITSIGTGTISTTDGGALALDVSDADTLLNAGVVITNGYNLSDSESSLLAAIQNHDIAFTSIGTGTISTNDSGAVSLDLSDADTLLGANVVITNGYNLVDSESLLLAAIQNNDIAFTSIGTGTISTNDATAVSLDLSDADTLLNANVVITHGYNLVDSEALLLAAIQNNDIAFTSIGTGTISTNDATAVSLDLSDADTLLNANVVITHGYNLVDSEASLLAAIQNHDIAFTSIGAGTISTNDATAVSLDLSDAATLLNAHVTITNGYNLVDSEASLLAAIQNNAIAFTSIGAGTISTNDATAVSLDLSDADTLLNAHVVITNGYNLSDSEASLLAAIQNNDIAFTSIGTGTISTTDGGALALDVSDADTLLNAHVVITNGYNLVDSEASLLAAIQNNAIAFTSIGAGTISTNDATAVSLDLSDADTLLNAHVVITNGYNLVDSEASLLAAIQNNAIAFTSIGAGTISTNDATAVSLDLSDADTLLNAHVVITNGYNLSDSEASLLAAIQNHDIAFTSIGTGTISTTDGGALALDVSDADTLLNAHVVITNGYNLVDSEASLLAAIQNNAIAFTSIGAGTISTNDATAVSLDLSDADTLLNAHVVITNGYNLVDSEASLLAAIQNNAIAFTSIGAGTISTNDATAVSLDLSDADTLLNTHVVITNGYNLVDSEASLLAAIQNNAIAFTSIGAGTISTNDATAVSLDLSDADTLLNAHVVITNGYNLSDSEASLLAAIQNHDIAITSIGTGTISTTDGGALALDLSDADTLLNAHVVITNGYNLSDSEASLLAAIQNNDIAFTSIGTGTISTTDGGALALDVSDADTLLNAHVVITNGYNLVDSEASLLAAIQNNAIAFTSIGAGTISTNDATAVSLDLSDADTLLNAHVVITNGYNLVDSEASLLAAIQNNAIAFTSIGAGTISTNDATAVSLDLSDADTLLNTHVVITNGYNLVDSEASLLAAIQNNAIAFTSIGAGTISTNDATAVSLDLSDADTLLNAHVVITNGYNLSDSEASLLAAIQNHDIAIASIGTGTISTTDGGALALDLSDADTLLNAHVVITNGYNLSDSEASLLAAIQNHDIAITSIGTGTISTTDGGALALDVSDADTLLNAHVVITNGYNLVDSEASLLAAIQNHDIAFTSIGAGTISTNDATAVSLDLSDADTLLNTNVVITNGYNLVDSESLLLAAIQNHDIAFTSIGAGTISTNDATAVSLDLSDADTLLNTHVVITNGYNLVDSEASLLAAIQNNAIAFTSIGAGTISTNDATAVSLDLSDADTLLNAHVVITNGYNLSDSEASLLAAIQNHDIAIASIGTGTISTTDGGALALDVSDADTLLNAHVVITNGYNLSDSEASLLAAIQNHDIAFTSIGTGTISTTDGGALALDVSDADTLLNAHVVITNGYNLVDSEASLLAAIQNNAIAFTSIGAGTISTNDATAVSLDLSDADTLLNAHVVITNGYNLVDSEASLLAAIQNNAIAFTSIGAGTISTNDATAVSLDLSDADTLLNTHVVITNGYNLVDSEASLLAAIQNNAIAFTSIGAGTISTNDATAVSLDLSDADTLLNAHVVITNGYNLSDSEASLLAAIQNHDIAITSIGTGTISTTDGGALALDLSDADTLLNAHVVITNGYNLSDSEASLLAAIQNNDIAFTSIGTGTISTTDGGALALDVSDADTLLNAHVVITNGYNLVDSEASLLAAIQNNAIAFTSIGAGTISTNDATAVSLDLSDADTLLNAHVVITNGYNLVDSEASLLAAIQNNAIAFTSIGAGTISTNDATAVSLDLSDADTLLNTHVVITNGYNLVDSEASLLAAIQNNAIAFTSIGAGTISTNDATAVSLDLSDADTLLNAHVVITNGYNLSDSEASLLAAIQNHDIAITSIGTGTISTTDGGALALDLSDADTLLNAHVVITNGYNLSDSEASLLAAIQNNDIAFTSIGTGTISTTDGGALALDVSDADTLLNAHVVITNGYNLVDSEASLLAAIQNNAIAFTSIGAGTISTNDATAVSLDLSDADTLLNAHVVITNGYNLVDSEASLLAAIQNNAIAFTSIGAGTISTNDATAVSLDLSDADTLLNTHVVITNGYNLVDSEASLLAAIQNNAIAFTSIGAGTISTNDATAVSLDLSDADTLLNAHVVITNGYNLSDSEASLLAAIQNHDIAIASIGTGTISTTDGGALALDVSDADTLLNAHVVITNGYNLSDSEASLLAAIQNNDIAFTSIGTGTISTTDGGALALDVSDADTLLNAHVVITNGYNLVDSEASLLAAIQNNAIAFTSIGAGTISTNDATAVSLDLSDADTLLNAHVVITNGYNLVDSEASLLAAIQNNAIAFTSIGAGTISTNDATAVSLDLSDADTLLNTHVVITNGYNLVDSEASLLAAIQNNAIAFTSIGAGTISTNDATAVSLDLSDADTLLNAHVVITNGYNLSDSEASLLAAIQNHDIAIASIGTGTISTTDGGALALDVSDADTLLNAHVVITNGYNLSDSEASLLAAIQNNDIAFTSIGTGTISTTDGGALALDVSDADTLLNAHVVITNGYNLSDSEASLLAAIQNNAIAFTSIGAGTISTNDATAVSLDLSDADTLLNAHVVITNGYNLVDSEASLLAAIQNNAIAFTSIGAGTISTNDATAVSLDLSDADTLLNTHVVITNGYNLVDSEASLLAAIQNNAIAFTSIGAGTISTNDATAVSLDLSDADTLLNAHVVITNGYNLSDSEASLLAAIQNHDIAIASIGTGTISTTDGGALALDVSDADTLLNAHVVITNGYNLSDSESSLLAAIQNHDIAITSIGEGTISTNDTGPVAISLSAVATLQQAGVDITNGFTLSDTSTDLLLPANSAAVSAASAVAATDTVSITTAASLYALNSNTTYSISDTAADLVAANAAVINGHAVNLTVSDPANATQAVTINSFTVTGAKSYTISDTVANLSTGQHNWATFTGATSVTAVVSTSTNLTTVTLDQGVTAINLNGQAVKMTDSQAQLNLVGIGTVTEVLSANRNLMSGSFALNGAVTALDLNGHTAQLTSAELALLVGGLTDSIGGGSVAEQLSANVSGPLNSFVTSLDLDGHQATLTANAMAALTITDSAVGGSIKEQLTANLDLTTTLNSNVTAIDLEGHTVKLTGTELSNLTVSDSVGGGTITEQLTQDTNLTTLASTSLITGIDLNGHVATMTAAELNSLTISDSVGGGYVIEQLQGSTNLTTGLNSHVQELDLAGYTVKLTDTELASGLTHGLIDSSSGLTGSVVEQFTTGGDLTSSSLNSLVHGLDLNGNSVTLTDTQLGQINFVNDTLGGGSVTESDTHALNNGDTLSLVTHSTTTLNLDLNDEVAANATVTIAGLQHNDTLNVGTSTLTSAVGSAQAVNQAGEYFFDTSAKTLTWDDSSSHVHSVVLANVTSVTLEPNQHTFTVI
ncbi:hypothetical protein [Paraburkholderia sp. RL17-337-BIB-A]|uniref:hypothetical protein n=1 Tax=Paraburkholderia sp. RL17-337-BIB-A TaxID=3031636 RepID=UPI0038B8D854